MNGLRHIVIVPTWRRPEALYWALTSLLEAERHAREDVFLYVVEDEDSDPATQDVVRDCLNRRDLSAYEQRTQRETDGGSWNILQAWKTAADLADSLGASLIHVVEEDVEVSWDYFTFAQAVHARFRPWAVSAAMNHNDLVDGPRPIWPEWDRPEAVYLHPYYQSVAVSIPTETVRQDILPHVTMEYFRDRAAYVKATFPGSLSGTRRWEQAGLVNRIMESSGGLCLYPLAPRARHAGFYGHNRPAEVPQIDGRPWREAPLEKRIEAWAQITPEQANSLADIRDTVPLSREGFDTLPEDFHLLTEDAPCK